MIRRLLQTTAAVGLLIAQPAAAVTIDLVSQTGIATPIGTNGPSVIAGGISDDGRYALVSSGASNLVPGDTNQATDLFLYDHTLASLERVSVADDETQANAATEGRAGLSADGRYVVFTSRATNLVTADTHGVAQVFLRDRVAQTTSLISRHTDGTPGGLGSSSPQISADGRYVVFVSANTFIAAAPTLGVSNIYRYDRISGAFEVVSVAADGTPGNRDSDDPHQSADGRYVAFHTLATNLVPPGTNAEEKIVLRDTVGNSNVEASALPLGGQPDSPRRLAAGTALSADGRYVLFNTALALDAADVNNKVDGFRFDRVTQSLVHVTREGGGGISPFQGYEASGLSAAGDRIVMGKRNTPLTGTNNETQHYVRDLATGTVTLIKQREGSASSYDHTDDCQLAGSGAIAYCASRNDYLVDADTNGVSDVFRNDLAVEGGARITRSLPDPVAAANDESYQADVSEDGRFVAFSSSASNLTVDDTNTASDVFLRDRLTGTTQRISRMMDGGEASCGGVQPRITPDGRYVVFSGCNLLLGWQWWELVGTQIYRYDRLSGQLQVVSLGSNGTICGNYCRTPSISDDGDLVAYINTDSWTGLSLVVRRISTGATQVANRPAGGGAPTGFVDDDAQISGDGRFVLFTDSADNLVTGDTNGVKDVFAYTVGTGTVARVSVGASAGQLDQPSRFLGVSRDGARVLLANADPICPSTSLRLHDRVSGEITCIGDDLPDGEIFNYSADSATLSGSGDRVAFTTSLPGGARAQAALLYDHTNQRVHRVTPPATNLDARELRLSASGDFLVFTSTASTLVANDGNYIIRDAFIAERLADDTLFADGFQAP